MLEFIKMFGLGILYTILFPFIVAIFGAYVVYVFFNYLVLELVSIFGFFFGYTFTPETELERKLALSRGQKNDSEIKDASDAFEDFFLKGDLVEELKGSDEYE